MADDLDLKEELKEELRYRLRSPFYSSLLIAFVLWNWKAVVIMLYPSTETGLVDRFLWIAKLYPEHAWVPTLLLPIASACIAVAGIPWVVNYLDDLRYQALVRRRNNRKQRDEKLLEVQKKISELNGEITAMRKVIRESEDRIVKQAAEINTQNTELEAIRRSFTSVAVNALGRDTELIKKFRGLTDTGNALEPGSPPAHTLIGYGLISQSANGRQDLTPIGKVVRDYIRAHVNLP